MNLSVLRQKRIILSQAGPEKDWVRQYLLSAKNIKLLSLDEKEEITSLLRGERFCNFLFPRASSDTKAGLHGHLAFLVRHVGILKVESFWT